MARQRFCRVCGGWHEPEAWPHNCMPERNLARSDLPGPMIISDTMEPVQSQLDGKFYDSKAALRSTYRAAGVVEVGNDSSVADPKPFKRPKPKREEIKASVNKAFSRAGLGA
jgi:hypothetical protein